MPTFYTGDNNLDAALTGLAKVMLPDANTQLMAQYRRAAATKQLADAAKTEREAQILAERQARSAQLASSMGDMLVQENLGDEPGISTTIAGPPLPTTSVRESYLRDLPHALLARDGNMDQFAGGVNKTVTGSNILFGPQDEAALRRNALVLSGGTAKYDKGDAITQGVQQSLLDDIQAADHAAGVAKEQAKLHNVPKGNIAVDSNGRPVAYGVGAAPGAAGAPGGGLDLEGTGVDAQAFNYVSNYNNKLDRGETPTPEETRNYGMMFGRLYAPKNERIQVYNEAERRYEYTTAQVAQPVPPGVRIPEGYEASVNAASGVATPQVASPAGGAVGTQAQPQVQPAGTPLIAKPDKQSHFTETQGKYRIYSQRIDMGLGNMMQLIGYNPQSGEFGPGFRPGLWDDWLRDWPQMIRGYFASDQQQQWFNAVATALNPLIRADSGAAVPDGEYPRYYDQFIPLAGEGEPVIRQKMDNLIITNAAFKEVAASGVPLPSKDSSQDAKDTWNAAMQTAKARIAQELGLKLRPINYGPNGPLPVGGAPPMQAPSSAGRQIVTPSGTFVRQGG